jgi:hypothetical protein
MTYPASENELARKSKEMNNSSMPIQTTNVDYGKKRKAKNHKFSVRDTKTGQTYQNPAIAETLTLKSYLIKEATDEKLHDKLTTLPEVVIKELKKLIKKGAIDVAQNWENGAELVNTAYHVARIRRPVPNQKGAWKQYEELLKYGVHQLWNSRGNQGSWRAADVMYNESVSRNIQPIYEASGSHRFFVMIPNVADVEVEGSDLDEVVHDMINKLRRHGSTARISHKTSEGAILSVVKDGQQVEEIIIKHVS